MKTSLNYLLASTALLCAAPAIAQDATQSSENATGGLDEIVVTAQRRAERVQDIPIAIAVVAGAQLERQQVVEVRDLARTTASLQFGPSGGGAQGGGGMIRGIGTFGFVKGSEAAVGIVVDGVVQGNTNITNLFDIARVEVLRGPQGTLFGQSVSAGVINISTTAPDPDAGVSGRFSTELSGDGFAGSKFGRQVVRGAVNLPVSASSALRFSAYANRTDGVTHNTYLGEDEILREFGGRVRFLTKLGETVTVNLAGDYNKSDQDNGSFFQFFEAKAGTSLATQLAACGATVGPKGFNNCSQIEDSVSDTKVYGGSGQVDVELGDNTLTSITAFRKQLIDQSLDVDRLPPTNILDIQSNVETNHKQFTQEVRFASPSDKTFSYTVGGFYQRATTGNSQPSAVVVRPAPGVVIRPPASLKTQDSTITNASLFGEGKVKMEAVTLFAGARITKSKVEQVATKQTPVNIGPVLTNTLGFKDTDVSWRAGAQYNVGPDMMVFASVARGYKSAQINNENFAESPPSNQVNVVAPEKPFDIQAGVKSSWFSNKLAANINLFRTKVKNFQTLRCLPPDPGAANITCLPINVSSVVTKGIEADFFGNPAKGVNLNAGLLYNVAKYPSDFVGTFGGSLGGQQIAFAPRWRVTFSGEYATPVVGDVEGFVALDAQYKSKTRMGIGRATSDFIYPDRFVFGGRIGARVNDGWSVALFARNIGNKPMPSNFENPATPPGDPFNAGIWQMQGQQSKRLVGLQADFQF